MPRGHNSEKFSDFFSANEAKSWWNEKTVSHSQLSDQRLTCLSGA